MIDGSKKNLEKMVDLASNKKNVLVVDTNTESTSDEADEYLFLSSCVRKFSQSDRDVMLARFSGREQVAKDIGDVSSEMIVTMSYNKNSRYYTGCPVNIFESLLNIFEMEAA